MAEAAARRSAAAGAKLLIDMAKGNGQIDDPTDPPGPDEAPHPRRVGRFNNLRLKAAKKAGQDIPGIGNMSKLSMSDIMRSTRDLGLRIIGADGMLHAYTDDQRAAIEEATGSPFGRWSPSIALFAQGPPIYGGTDQIQRNIIGERVLGLPKEPGDTRTSRSPSCPRTPDPGALPALGARSALERPGHPRGDPAAVEPAVVGTHRSPSTKHASTRCG